MSKLEELINKICADGVKYAELREILKIKNGSDYKGFSEGTIPVYGSGGILAYIDRYAYNKPSVLIPRKGSIDKLYKCSMDKSRNTTWQGWLSTERSML